MPNFEVLNTGKPFIVKCSKCNYIFVVDFEKEKGVLYCNHGLISSIQVITYCSSCENCDCKQCIQELKELA